MGQHIKMGECHAVVLLIEALRYKPEGCGFNSRWWLEFFIDNPSGLTMALGSTQLLTEMRPRNIFWA